MYSLRVSPEADRELGRLGERIQRRDFERLRAAISGLAHNPRPQGVRKLEGKQRAWRIRVGDYRVIYEIDDEQALVLILKVARRSEATYTR